MAPEQCSKRDDTPASAPVLPVVVNSARPSCPDCQPQSRDNCCLSWTRACRFGRARLAASLLEARWRFPAARFTCRLFPHRATTDAITTLQKHIVTPVSPCVTLILPAICHPHASRHRDMTSSALRPGLHYGQYSTRASV
jgi:hypothetical protein